MAEFGILNDVLGVRSGVPHTKLPQALASGESSWVYYWRNAMRMLPGRGEALSGTVAPDGNPIIRYHHHESSAGLEYLFAYTKAHVYQWDNGNTEWDLMFTCASACTQWSSESFGQYIVSTNNIDKVQSWDDTAPTTAFANLGSANGIEYSTGVYLTKAEYVIKHWNFLHLLSTTENGVGYKYFDRWCSAGDITDWDEDGAGDANYRQLGLNDKIRGAGIYDSQGANHLIIFTDKSINAAWLNEEDTVYTAQTILSMVGCVSADSIVNTPDGQLYYLSVDETSATVEVRKVYDPNPVSYDIQPTLDLMHPTLRRYACGTYIGALRQVWWSIPGAPDSTANDKVMIYNLQTGTWNATSPMDIQAFGFYTQQSTTFINDITENINDMLNMINTYGSVAGSPITLCSDADGYTWSAATSTQDKGVDYNSSLVLATDLGDGGLLNRNKRLHGVYLFYESRPGTTHTATASIREGHKSGYTNMGSVSLAGDGKTVRGWIPHDTAFRDCHLKLASSNNSAFLGAIFKFTLTGERL